MRLTDPRNAKYDLLMEIVVASAYFFPVTWNRANLTVSLARYSSEVSSIFFRSLRLSMVRPEEQFHREHMFRIAGGGKDRKEIYS
jgi:hypothetical protein